MELTGKQKRFLRSMGNRMEAVIIGHAGLSENVLKDLILKISKEELVKIRINKSTGKDMEELLNTLCDELNATIVQTFGSTALLYKQSSGVIKLPK